MVIYGKVPKAGLLVNNDFVNIKFRSLQGDYDLTSLNPKDLLIFYSSVLPLISGKTCQVEEDLYPFLKRTVKKYTGFKLDKICNIEIIKEKKIHEDERKVVEEAGFFKRFYTPLFIKPKTSSDKKMEETIEIIQETPTIVVNCNNNSGVAPQETKSRSYDVQILKVAYWRKQHSKGVFERIYIDTTHGNCYLDVNSKRMFNKSFEYDPDMNIIKSKTIDFLGFKTDEQLFAFKSVKELK